MLKTRCRIQRREETMTDKTDGYKQARGAIKPERHSIWQTADRLQMNLRTCQAQLVELRSYLAALDLPGGWKPPRAGSPRELHPDSCPYCELAASHTQDCPIVTGDLERDTT